MLINPRMTDADAAVREEDLVVPTLLVLAKAQEAKFGGMTTAQLGEALRSITVLSEADKAKTPGDKVSRFQRQVMNLVSHNTLVSSGWARYLPNKDGSNVRRLSITLRGKAELARLMIEGIGLPRSERPPAANNPRAREKAISKPALFVLASLQMSMEGPVPMTTLRTTLSRVLPKNEEDMAILKNRKDARIDQVIRNLISHRTLEKNNWVKRGSEGMTLTAKGYAEVLKQLIKPVPTPPMFKTAKRNLSKAVSRSETPAARREIRRHRTP